jgi:hypothetical protein
MGWLHLKHLLIWATEEVDQRSQQGHMHFNHIRSYFTITAHSQEEEVVDNLVVVLSLG